MFTFNLPALEKDDILVNTNLYSSPIYTPNQFPSPLVTPTQSLDPSAALFVLTQSSGSRNGCGALEKSTSIVTVPLLPWFGAEGEDVRLMVTSAGFELGLRG